MKPNTAFKAPTQTQKPTVGKAAPAKSTASPAKKQADHRGNPSGNMRNGSNTNSRRQ